MPDAAPAPTSSPPDRRGEGLGIAVGLVISSLLSAALVYSAAKAGIAPGVSPLVVLFGWVGFGAFLGTRLKRFLALGQVTGSAGAAVTAGVVFTAPIVQIVSREQGLDVPPVDVPLLILASVAGSLLGFGFVGLATKRFLSDPRLPAPEAVAADRLIATAVSRPDERPRVSLSLVPGLLLGVGVNLAEQLRWLRHDVATLSAPLFGGPARDGGGAQGDIDLPIPLSPLYIGIGALLTLPTALLIFAGGLVNAGTKGYSRAHGLPDETFRWVGGAAMTVAVVYSLVAYVIEGRRAARGADALAPVQADGDDALLEQSPGVRRMLLGSITLGMVVLGFMMARVGAPPLAMVVLGAVTLVLVSLLSGLGGLLSLQVGSSASPVSGTVFMGMLVLSLTALGVSMSGMQGIVFLVPLVVAACVAICAANDSSQDYKTLQLNGYRVSDGFKGQIIGLLGGSVVVPLTLWLAHESNLGGGGLGLGDADLPAPQASFFGTVLQSLFLQAEMPWGPVMAGAALGVVAVAVEAWGKRRGVILSSLAFAVGIYLSPEMGIGMGLGAFARFAATRKVSATTHEGILMAAGLITGYALLDLLYGIVLVTEPAGEAGLTDLLTVGSADALGWVPGATGGAAFGVPLLAATLVFIFVNYRSRTR